LTGLLLAALLAQSQPEVVHLPPLAGSFDAIAYFMPGGNMPMVPWHGLPERTSERLWAYSCSSMLVQRTAWCAYIVISPAGLADSILPGMIEIEPICYTHDQSDWSRALALAPLDTTDAVIVVWHASDSIAAPPRLPLRYSAWLSTGADTLILNGSWLNSILLRTSARPEGLSPAAAWRGAGSEVIPLDSGSVASVSVSSSGGTPADLPGLLATMHPWDAAFALEWGVVFSAIDSLVASQCPLRDAGTSLMWLKGSGYEGYVSQGSMTAVTAPPARASFAVPVPRFVPVARPPSPPPEDSPVVRAIVLQCPGAGEDLKTVMAGVLERTLARSCLEYLEGVEAVSVFSSAGGLGIYFTGDPSMAPAESLLATARELMSATALCPPEDALARNAVLRGSLQTGRTLQVPDPGVLVMTLAAALGLP